MGEDGEEADQVEPALAHRKGVEGLERRAGRVVQLVSGVKVMELEPGVAYVRVEPADDLRGDIDPDVAAEWQCVVQERLDDLGAASDVEEIDSREVAAAERAAQQVDREPS